MNSESWSEGTGWVGEGKHKDNENVGVAGGGI